MRLARLVFVVFCAASGAAFAATTAADLKQEVERLRKEIAEREEGNAAPIKEVDAKVTGRYGPNASVVSNAATKQQKLEISGLMQVWYESIQNDHLSVSREPLDFKVTPPQTARLMGETNEGSDNDTFRVRRMELRFRWHINENIYAHVMIDPAREANESFVPFPTYPRHNTVLGPLVDKNLPSTQLLQNGTVRQEDVKPHLLQDAYIVFRNFVPHHSFQIGQFKPPVGEEALRDTRYLDFVDRSMVTSINNVRDVGVQVSGSWLRTDADNPASGRVQYDFGLFNGPTGTILSDPEITEAGARSDDNDEKDFAWRVQVRPVWNPDKWYGRLELGYHRTDGIHGESGQEFNPNLSLNAENLERTAVNRQGAWAWYRPGGPVRGWWMRGEWGSGKDRFGKGANTSLLGFGSVDLGVQGPRGGSAFTQEHPTPLTVQGWFLSTGYRLAESRFFNSTDQPPPWDTWEQMLHRMEFTFRYEVYQNVTTEDLVFPDRRSDQFKTQAWTAGLNYYITGQKVTDSGEYVHNPHNAKLQVNYVIVDDPESKSHFLREVRNNVFVVNFQVGF